MQQKHPLSGCRGGSVFSPFFLQILFSVLHHYSCSALPACAMGRCSRQKVLIFLPHKPSIITSFLTSLTRRACLRFHKKKNGLSLHAVGSNKYRVTALCIFLSQLSYGRLIISSLTWIFLHFKAWIFLPGEVLECIHMCWMLI